jgi:hypothetical protein
MFEEHKAIMARSKYTEQGMVDAQQKLAELQFAVTKACQTETAPITTVTTNTNTATVSLPPKMPIENCFDCQTWKNGAMFINPIYDVSYVDCNGKSFSKQSVLPNQEIQVKAGTLYYPKSVSDMSFNGESNFRNLLREPISKINTHDLMLKSSNKVCEKISSSASFNGGFANSVDNNYFSNNFLNADGGGQPDGTGDYSTELILPFNTTVYIRGFATNQYGTSYGSQVVFKVNASKRK